MAEDETRSESGEEEGSSKDKTRREFIKLAGLGAGAVVAAKLLPELSDGAGTDRAGVLGKPPPQPPSGTTNPYEHTVEVKINPTAANPTNPYANYPTLEVVTPNNSAYAKPALSIANGTAPSTPVTTVDKNGNVFARSLKTESTSPSVIPLDIKMAPGQTAFAMQVTDSAGNYKMVLDQDGTFSPLRVAVQASTPTAAALDVLMDPYQTEDVLRIWTGFGEKKGAVDKDGTLTARAIQNVMYTPYFSSLQAALYALPASGGIVFHPAVSLACDTQVKIKPYVTLVGSGWKTSRFDFSGSTNTNAALSIWPGMDADASTVLRDFELKGSLEVLRYGITNSPAGTTQNMICWNTLFDNLYVHDFGNSLMMFDGTWSAWGNMTLRNSMLFRSKQGNCLQMKTYNRIPKIYNNYFAEAGWIKNGESTTKYNDRFDVDIQNIWGSYSMHNNTFEIAFGGLRLGYCFGGMLGGNYFEGLTAGLTITEWCQGLDVGGNFFCFVNYPINVGRDRLTSVSTGAHDIDMHANFMDNVDWDPNSPDPLKRQPMMAFTWAGTVTGCRACSNVLQRFLGTNPDGTYHDFSLVTPGQEPAIVEDCHPGGVKAPILLGNRVFRGKSSLALRVKSDVAGVPDVSYGADDGTIVYNSVDHKLYIREGGNWRAVQLS